MKIAAIWTRATEYSEDVTKNARQLALGGVAVCWVLKGAGALDAKLLWALGFLVLFFTFDILQGFLGFMVRRVWLYFVEKQRHRAGQSIDGEVDQPRWLDSPSFVLFNAKVAALLTAYAFVIAHVIAVI